MSPSHLLGIVVIERASERGIVDLERLDVIHLEPVLVIEGDSDLSARKVEYWGFGYSNQIWRKVAEMVWSIVGYL